MSPNDSIERLVEIAHDREELTFQDLAKALGKLKVSAFIWVLTMLGSAAAFSYYLGARIERWQSGDYQLPSMDAQHVFNLEIESKKVISLLKEEGVISNDSAELTGVNIQEGEAVQVLVNGLYIIEDMPNGGRSRFSLRRIINGDPSDTRHVGDIIPVRENHAQAHNLSLQGLLPKVDLIQPVHAQGENGNNNLGHREREFEWYGHEDNFEFQEKYIDTHTIQRSYANGWILKYDVDENGASMAETFEWEKKVQE